MGAGMTPGPRGDLTLVLGGARSGKSDLALRLASEGGGRILFVATMPPGDDEVRERIARHRERRPRWDILEEPLAVPERLARVAGGYKTILLDCLTLWVSNLLLEGRDVKFAVQELLDWHAASDATLVVVSNEAGSGVVPATALGRVFRDELGAANRMLAARASAVYYLVAGVPLQLVPGARGALSPLQTEGATDDSRP